MSKFLTMLENKKMRYALIVAIGAVLIGLAYTGLQEKKAAEAPAAAEEAAPAAEAK